MEMKMMKKVRMTNGILVSVLALTLLFAAGITAFAAGTASDEKSIPEDAESYTLTYPDGTVVTKNENGEPLTYADVTRLLKEENWKEMAMGLTSDEKGNVILDPQWEKGTIKIVETGVPEGYLKGGETEKVVDLAEGNTTFVNPRKPQPEPDPQPSEDPPAPDSGEPQPEPDPQPSEDPPVPDSGEPQPEPDPHPSEAPSVSYPGKTVPEAGTAAANTTAAEIEVANTAVTETGDESETGIWLVVFFTSAILLAGYRYISRTRVTLFRQAGNDR